MLQQALQQGGFTQDGRVGNTDQGQIASGRSEAGPSGASPSGSSLSGSSLSGFGPREIRQIEVVTATATGSGVRRRHVPAISVGPVEAVRLLPHLDSATPGTTTWSAVLQAGLQLLARGRLYPSVTATGSDCWAAGPLDPADRRLLAELSQALPPAGYALPLQGSPLRLHSPQHLVAAVWDALADILPRTRGAAVLLARPEMREVEPPGWFTSPDRVDAETLRPWLAEAAGGFSAEQGADVALRIELDVTDPRRDSAKSEGQASAHLRSAGLLQRGGSAPRSPRAVPATGSHHEMEDLKPVAHAIIQLTSRAESSLVVDAADLFQSPAAVLARFGGDAEIDLLRALRRGARAWEPLEPLLHERAPSGLELSEDLLAELLADGATLLQGTGIAVLWPREIITDGIELRAAITATPGVVAAAGFDLATLVEFQWQATLHGELLSEEEVNQLAEAKRGLVRLRGHFVAADPGLLERLLARRRHRLSAAEALGALLAGSVDLGGESVPVVGEGPLVDLARQLSSMTGGEASDRGIPPGLAGEVELRPYQRRGVNWLAAMTDSGLGGCLADDMGLGKTLQVIALHLHRVAAGKGPTLVICPTSLLGNWEREVRRFAPELTVRRHHGPGRNLGELADADLVVTSYGVARLDAEILAGAGFALVVADEAQHAKNPETATARALRQIGGPARLALTGTPVENRLADLWALLDWTTPGLLGPFDHFIATVATPIERDRDPVTTERLTRTIRPFLLRRRKSDPGVAPDLPPRTVTDVAVPLTPEQTTLYEAEVREALAVIENKDGIARQGLVLRLLTVLKQICNHPAQYLHESGPLPGRSGKLAALEELVNVIVAEGESVLVFSQFVECLSLVESRLASLGIPTLFIHGKVGAKRRTAMVEEFQRGEALVMLASLKAGGVGLNLTRATHVVHYDRWWNPAVEDQATDRAHRIGQDRPVQVHRLIAEGTLEDHIATLIESKRSLAEAVVGGGESWIGKLSNEELADLVRLGRSQ